jgi:hypothetical protein
VRRIAAITLALLLGVILAGGHLALLQGVAWASMLISRASTAPLAVAVSTTFDGKHPCAICQELDRHQHDAAPGAPAPDQTAKKMKTDCLPMTAWSGSPAASLIARLIPREPPLAAPPRDAPPTPPPTRS